jgi:hypothetical protein
VTTEQSKRPAMAFVSFIRDVAQAVADAEPPRTPRSRIVAETWLRDVRHQFLYDADFGGVRAPKLTSAVLISYARHLRLRRARRHQRHRSRPVVDRRRAPRPGGVAWTGCAGRDDKTMFLVHN